MRRKVIAIIAVIALLVVAGIVALVVANRGQGDGTSAAPSPTATSDETSEPDPADPGAPTPTEPTEDDLAVIGTPARPVGASEVFYFVVTDRFANGDPGNDTGGLEGDRYATGFDPTDSGFFQGGDFRGLIDNLDYLVDLGVTAIWVTPPFVNQAVQGGSAAYHGYWITDFTDIDAHLGGREAFDELIDAAHARGIRVFADVITNHTADVIDYAEGIYSYVSQSARPYTDTDGNEFWLEDTVGKSADEFPAMSAETSFPYTPVFRQDSDAGVKHPEWLNDVTLYHNRGNSMWTGESVTLGDFQGLDDVMTHHPRVVEGFIDVYKSWVDSGVDGFRIDTVKHVNFEFWQAWTTAIMEHARSIGREDFFMFGEVFDADASLLAPYLRYTDMPAVLDFAFQSQAVSWAGGDGASRLASLFAADDFYVTPHSSASFLPTFLGNHDMGRVGFLLRGAANPLQSTKLAHELMFYARGMPVVYYGDEQGFAGVGGDKDARQSLFATAVESWKTEPLLTGDAMGSQDHFNTDSEMFRFIADLAEVRAAHPALQTGGQIERLVESGRGIYAFSRVDRDEKIEYLVALNSDDTPHTATVPTLTPSAGFEVIWGADKTAVTSDETGGLTITVPGMSTVVWKADATVAPSSAQSAQIRMPADGVDVYGPQVMITAEIDSTAWAETSFGFRIVGDDGSPVPGDDGQWQRLGTTESPRPRVFHDVGGLSTGTRIEYRVVTVDAAGSAASATSIVRMG